jgi:hypothetical protein
MAVDLLANHHLCTVTDVLTSIEEQEVATDASVYDVYEQDDFGLSRLLVESKLGEPLREKIRIRYDHLVNFYDLPGPAIFEMAMLNYSHSHNHSCANAQTNPSAQRATQLRIVLARVCSVSRQNLNSTTVP